MDSYMDTWMSGTTQLTKSIIKDTAQSTSASNITGRKLNSFLNVIKKPDSNHPRIIEQSNQLTSRSRLKAHSKSPLRSTSQRTLKPTKSAEKPTRKAFSPPRHQSKPKNEKFTLVKNESKSKKNLLNEFSNTILRERSDNLKRNVEDSEKKQNLKVKLEKVNKKIREKNAKGKKKGRKERDMEKTRKKDENLSSSRENDRLRVKARAEREASRPSGKKITDPEHTSHVKVKKFSPPRPDKPKSKKSPDPGKRFIKPKKKSQKLPELQKHLEETLKEIERLHTLEKSSKRKKSSKRSRMSKHSEKPEDFLNSLLTLTSTKKRSEKPKKKHKFHISSDCLSEKLKSLQERIYSNYDLMKIKAATKIQQWFRSTLHKSKRRAFTEQSADWASPMNTSDQPKFSVQETLFKSPEAFDSLLDPTITTNSANISSFQSKRPKQLNIDYIISPMITNNSDSEKSNSQTAGQLLSPTFNQSPSSESDLSSEVFVNVSHEDPVQDTPSLQQPESSVKYSEVHQETPSPQHPESSCSGIKEPSLHSFTVAKIETEGSDKDSLENDISEISSALVKTNLNNSYKLEEPKESLSGSEQIITSPEISYSITDVIEEIIAKELETFATSVKFVMKDKDVDATEGFLDVYLNSLFEELSKNEEEILELINTPGFVDPLSKLALLQNTDVGELPKRPNLEIILPSYMGTLLKDKLASKIKAREIYLQMTFDCVNEALNHIRPFGLKGVPDPWISEPRLLFGEGELKRVQKLVKDVVDKWIGIRGGIFCDSDEEFEEEKLQSAREERMSKLLCFDVNCDEVLWVDYEDEESQSKLDLADIVLDMLLKETAEIMNV